MYELLAQTSWQSCRPAQTFPVLGIFGGADNSIPVSEVKAFEAALNEAGVSNQISIYENQPHAFVKSIEEIRRGGAQGQAWEEVRTFLKETLRRTVRFKSLL